MQVRLVPSNCCAYAFDRTLSQGPGKRKTSSSAITAVGRKVSAASLFQFGIRPTDGLARRPGGSACRRGSAAYARANRPSLDGQGTGPSRRHVSLVLCPALQKLVGAAPLDYLLRFRMRVARGALRSGKRTVSAVAFEMGYRSESAFSTAFKRIVGAPPKDFRGGSVLIDWTCCPLWKANWTNWRPAV
jgi:hypothetical protein